MREKAKELNNLKMYEKLNEVQSVTVHIKCRNSFRKRKPSCDLKFDFYNLCVLCGSFVRGYKNAWRFVDENFNNELKERCEIRNDEWASKIQFRLDQIPNFSELINRVKYHNKVSKNIYSSY